MFQKTLFLLLVLFAFQVWAEENDDDENPTQVESRQKRKWNLLFSNKTMNSSHHSYNLELNYNIGKKFSIGYRHIYRRDYEEKLTLNQAALANGDYLLQLSKSYNYLDRGILNFRYYFWDTVPFYLTAGIARTYTTGRQMNYFTELRFSGNNPYLTYPFELYFDRNPYYSRMLGIGFQWVFESGLTFGTEFYTLKSINGATTKREIYYSPYLSYSRLTEIYFRNQEKLGLRQTTHFEISLGYSF